MATQPIADATILPAPYILVVDDEEVVRDFLNRCLEGWGYGVKQAASAPEALQFVAAQPPALVLCDIRMPGPDGFWFAERLRTDWPEVPLVMATGLDDLQTVRQSRSLGAIDYITKPIKPDQLQKVVRRCIVTAGPEPAPPGREPVEMPSDAEVASEGKFEAEYALESPLRCPACGERMTRVAAVRLVRAHVNFTSTLPRRGRVLACPNCLAVISGELSNF